MNHLQYYHLHFGGRHTLEINPTSTERQTQSAWNGAGIHDTGLHLRAFPPFTSSNARADIHKYEGTTIMTAARTTYIKPKLNITIVYIPENVSFEAQVNGPFSLSIVNGIRDKIELVHGREFPLEITREFNCILSLVPGVLEWVVTFYGATPDMETGGIGQEVFNSPRRELAVHMMFNSALDTSINPSSVTSTK